ncbi:hypothetical protein [Streptomyces sp. NPDC046985]|uniref:hypothetical protein n=1 Tax=Streptomyces sp. NPDC046985 TaxID=3155377 RepID=UPI0033D7B5BD
MIQHVRRKLSRVFSAMPEVSIPISHAVQTAADTVLLLQLRLSSVLVTGVTVASLFWPELVSAETVLAVSLAFCTDRSCLVLLKVRRSR